MIKETVNEYHFTSTLLKDEYARWTYGATKALFDYLEQLSEEMEQDIELDPVAIRCDWTEYDSAWDAMLQYQPEDMPTVDEVTDEDGSGDDLPTIAEKSETLAREWLEERTTVLDVENIDNAPHEYRTIKSILVMQF